MQRLLVVSERNLARPLERLRAARNLEQDNGDVVLAAGVICAVDERARGGIEIVAVPLELLENGRVIDHRAQSVGAQHENVARLRRHGDRIDGDVRIRAERPRDDRTMRVLSGLVRGETAGAHELGDERVILRYLLENAVPEEICPRVADVPTQTWSSSTSATVMVVPIPETDWSLTHARRCGWRLR